MPLLLKVIVTIVALVAGPLICLVDLRAGPNSHWRLGRWDPLRNILFRQDGALRKYSRVGILAWLVLIVVLVWLIA